MNEIPIRFASLTDLAEFAALVGYSVFLHKRENLVLTGDFTDAEIELAFFGFKGMVLKSHAA